MGDAKVTFSDYVATVVPGSRLIIELMKSEAEHLNELARVKRRVDELFKKNPFADLTDHALPLLNNGLEEDARLWNVSTESTKRAKKAAADAARETEQLEAAHRKLRNEIGVRRQEDWVRLQEAMKNSRSRARHPSTGKRGA